jgi:hypothetical protein
MLVFKTTNYLKKFLFFYIILSIPFKKIKIEVIIMQKKENKKELEMAKKNSSTFKKLMQSKEFIEDILNTNDGKEIIDKFEAQGIDINKIQFSELCNILVQRLKSDDSNPNLEVSSIDSPISVDYEKRVDKTIIKFED